MPIHLRHACAIALMLLPAAAVAQAQSSSAPDTIGLEYVSPQRVFYESESGKAAQTKLAALEAATSKEVETRNARLRALRDSLAQGTSVLGEAARRQREVEIERFQVDLQRFVEVAQAQFLGVRRDLESTFPARFGPAVESVAKKRGLLFVLNQDAGGLAWADPSLDITSEVVAVVNQP